MTLRRLHLPSARAGAPRAPLGDEARHYLRDVLRLAPGAALEVFDGRGGAWEAIVLDGFEEVALGARRDAPAAAAVVWLLLALAKGEKLDLVVQKATELGVARVVLFAAARSVVRLEPQKGEERAERWRRIAAEAARQCGRSDVPEIAAPAALADALREPPQGFATFLFHPGGAPLSEAAPSPAGGYVAVIGPEGGLTDDERATCAAAGARAASLGPRVLRAETAAITAVALLQARFGDIGGGRPVF